jgi:Flp pilus assembly protein TadG
MLCSRCHDLLRSKRLRHGAAAVEFALLAPFIVYLVLGALEVSRGIMVKGVLSDAARRGCRTGIQGLYSGSKTTNTQVINDIDAVLTANNIPTADVTHYIAVNGNTSKDVSAAVRGDQISVKVSVPSVDIAWTTSIFLSRDTESETIVMMRQQ